MSSGNARAEISIAILFMVTLLLLVIISGCRGVISFWSLMRLLELKLCNHLLHHLD